MPGTHLAKSSTARCGSARVLRSFGEAGDEVAQYLRVAGDRRLVRVATMM